MRKSLPPHRAAAYKRTGGYTDGSGGRIAPQRVGRHDQFWHEGDLLKVKTYNEITKLEKNGLFLYESVPGTSVLNFVEREDGVAFIVEGDEDAQSTVGLADDKAYEVFVDGESRGAIKTGLGGKLSLSVELEAVGEVPVKIVQI